MIDWKTLIAVFPAIFVFVGINAKLQQMDIINTYWWFLILLGMGMLYYLNKNGRVNMA